MTSAARRGAPAWIWALAALLSAFLLAPAPHAEAASGSTSFGVNATSSVLQAPSASARRSALADIKALGGRYVRIDVTWSYIEPVPGVYQWSYYDAVMADIKAAGLEPIMLLAYGNTGYGSPTAYDPPPVIRDYSNWAWRVARRYSAAPYGFHVFEVWNEPNLSAFWHGAPSASEYAALLGDAYTALKDADPKSVVLSAGLAPSGMTAYASSLYAAGARGHFDGLAIHPYVGEGTNSIEDVRAVMVANGDAAKRLWATEFGWSSWVTPGNSEALQASRFTQFGAYWRTVSGHGPLIAYTHRDTTAPGAEGAFGLTRLDGSRKPAWTAFRGVVKAG
jgi:hypothetical protein